jgi:NADH-ubiquinone oxidoreductase chain 5
MLSSILTLLSPFLGALFAGFFGNFLGIFGSSFLAIFCLASSFLCALVTFYTVGFLQLPLYVLIGPWIQSDMLLITWGFRFDSLTIVMLLVITSVSLLVHIFSFSYLGTDPHLPRFMSYISLFTFFMLILVSADNFLVLFLGWEGVGLCSFLLISFWYTRLQAIKSALKAFSINRVGDLGLTLGIIFIYYSVQAVDFETIFSLAPYLLNKKLIFCSFELNTLNLVTFLLFIGSAGKSAQVGLHLWLPDAMEGPTPVSALIHAATMVTAGVFLIIRCSPIFEYAPTTLSFIAFFGGCTAFFASLLGCIQLDLKKVIAYSTCGQLGYMFLACGLSNYLAGLSHLVNHAFFKAALFLTAGSIIHALFDEQDLRKLSGSKLGEVLPFTTAIMTFSSASLGGCPYFSGYYSKDLILETAYVNFGFSSIYAFSLGLTAVTFTTIYSQLGDAPSSSCNIIRSLSYSSYTKGIQEIPILTMVLPLVTLSFGGLLSGFFLTNSLLLGSGSSFMSESIFNLPKGLKVLDAEFMPYTYTLAPAIITILGYFMAMSGGFSRKYFKPLYYVLFFVQYLVHYMQQVFLKKFVVASTSTKDTGCFTKPIFSTQTVSNLKPKYYLFSFSAPGYLYLFSKKFLFDTFFNKFFGSRLIILSYTVIFSVLDKGFLEVLGPKGLSFALYRLSNKLSSRQTGSLVYYLYTMLFSLQLLLTFLEVYCC